MMLTILVSGPKQPGDRIDVYLRPLVDDLKILWKPGVPEVWDEYKREEFTMHDMLFTTINDNLAQHNLLKSWALGRSSMHRKQRRGRTFLLLQPPCQRQKEKNFVSFYMI
jgi:hypothetical protein